MSTNCSILRIQGAVAFNSRIGPTRDNPKLRYLYWSLSRSADSTANTNGVNLA